MGTAEGMTRWLITGASGMLGRDLAAALSGREVTALDRSALDITDRDQVFAALTGHDIVVNTAAWTDVDAAEAHEAAATAINGTAVGHLTEACIAHGATLIHVSTDYVFPGNADAPYAEDATTDPVNAYGRSKLAGERLATSGYIVRTSWLYGRHGRNFIRTILGAAASRETLDVVADQLGQPTWTHSLARQIIELAASAAPPGVYHGTAAGQTTWFELAREAFRLAGLDPERVKPVSGDAYPRPARRPAYSVLGHDRWRKAGLSPQPAWEMQLKEAFAAGVFE